MFFDFCSQGNTIKLNETWNAGIFQITYNLEKLDKYSNDDVLSKLISDDVGLTYKYKFTSKYKIEDYLIYDAGILSYNFSENFPLKYYIYYLDEENTYTEYMQNVIGLNLGFGKIINTQDGFIEDFEQIDDIIKITKELYILLFIDGNPYATTLILE